MKLHLPKTLLAAVLACFTVGASYGVSVYSRATWDVDTIVSAIPTGGSSTKSWNGTTYTFTSSDGMLEVSGYALNDNSLSGITFEAKKTELQALSEGTIVSLVLIEFGDPEGDGTWANNHHTWGVNVKGTAEGSSSLFTGQADNTNNDWYNTSTDKPAPRTDVSNMEVTSTDSEGNEKSIVSAYFNKSNAPGVSLANGYASKTAQGECIYYADGLRWKDSTGALSLKFSTTYVTSLIQQADSYQSGADFYTVKNADGSWHKDYTSMANAVSATPVGATLAASGRLEITGDNATSLDTNGGDIIVGGSGQLYLNSSSDIVLGNAIYLGGSTYNDADTQGALYFGGSGTTTLSGGITLIEDSTMGADAQVQDVRITGNVSGGDHKLAIVQGTGIGFSGGMNLGILELASGVSIDISGTAATVGTISNTGAGARATVTGTTLTISGLYAGASDILTTGEGGQIVFGPDATIDVANLTATGNSDYTVDGFIQESYRVTASDVNASISGGTIALVKDGVSYGSAAWNNGEITMGGSIYNVATTKSYNDYLSEAEAASKTATSIVVQEGGTFVATDTDQTIAIAGADSGVGTLSANWDGRAQAGAGISTAAQSFHGAVVVKSGASWLIGGGYNFSSITVESGGQFGLDSTYTGDITISGTGTAAGADQQGALKFGDGGALTGNVTLSGNKAALSTWGTHAGTITGNINCTTEGGAELEILNGDGVGHIAANTITVTGNLSGINKVTTTAASMTVGGTIVSFGDTFTKSGAGTLTLSKAGAVTSGKVIVEGGILDLTGSGSAGTLSGVNVEVKKGATIKVGHDCAGWSGGTSSISLLGEEGNVATMINNDTTGNGNTWNTNINLNGHATVTGGNLMSFGGSLSAEGTGNTFASKLFIAKDFTVTVAEGGELEISGQIVNSGHDQRVETAKLIKAGAGELKLTHANNTFTRGGIVLNAGTLTIANASATTTAAGITGAGTLATSGSGIKTFSAAVAVGSLVAQGGGVVFNNTLTLDGANSSISGDATFGGLTTLNANLTVTGSTTLATTAASIAIANKKSFSTDGGVLTVTGTANNTAITTSAADAEVTTSNEAITISNAAVTVNSATDYTLGAKLSGSTLTNTGAGTATVKVEEGTTNDFDASQGSVTINAQAASVGDLTVGVGKTVTIGDGTGTATVSGTATLANGSTVSGNMAVATGGTATLENGSRVGGDVTIAAGGKLVIGGTGFSADGLGAIVEGTLTATATAISLADKINVSGITTTTTYVLATAQTMSTTGDWKATDFYTGTLAEGMTATVSVRPMPTATYDINPATASQLVLELTAANPDAPVSLTATTVVSYSKDLKTLYINVEGYTPDELTQLANKDLAVTVGSEAWASIVDAMSGVEGGVYNNAIISLNYLPLDHFGTVSFNGYTGTGNPGEYFVAYIPEPATATLSLLALAALAARRRRK